MTEVYCRHCEKAMRFHRLRTVQVRCPSPFGMGEPEDAATREVRRQVQELELAPAKEADHD